MAGPDSKLEKLNSKLLKEAIYPLIQCHNYPKMEIIVSCLVIESDGCTLPAAITCSSIALASSGLKMYDLAVGIGYNIVEKSQNCKKPKIVLDPTLSEEIDPDVPDVTLSYLPSFGQVSLFEVNKAINDEIISEILDNSLQVAQEIYSKMVATL